MSNSAESKIGKTCKLKYPQKLGKTTKIVDGISNEGCCVKRNPTAKAKEATNVGGSKPKKLKLQSSPEPLQILSVKESKGKLMIEFCSRSCSAPSISGGDSEPHSNQTTPAEFTEIKIEDQIDAERHNYQTVHDTCSAIKTEDPVDIKIEDEMEFSALGYTVRYVSETDFEEHSNQTSQDEITKIEDDEVETDAHKNSEPPEGDKSKSEFVCDICWKDYSSKGKLALHRMLHGKGKFLCGDCGMAKFSQQELDSHMRIHDTIYSCDICPKKYSKRESLVKHRLLHGFPKFHCTECGIYNLYQYQLDVHMREHDTNPIILACDTCPEVILGVRQGKRNFYCKVCGVPKVTQDEMDTYMKTHNAKPNCICDICWTMFSTKSNLIVHRMCHEPNLVKNPRQ